MKLKTLVILGGSGFVGKSILSYFLSKKMNKFKINKIILVSRNIEKIKKEFNIIGNKNIISKKINLLNKVTLPKGDYIIHAAEPTIYGVKDKLIFSKYYEATKKIVNFYSKFRNIKFIYLSSGAVYGGLTKKKKFQENSILTTKNMDSLKKIYAQNKINTEKYCLNNFNKKKLIIARLFTFIGKYIPKHGNYAVGNFMSNVNNLKTLKLTSPNPKKTIRSYLYADDLVNCLLKLAVEKNKSISPVYNVGSDKPISIYKAACEFSKISGLPLSSINNKNINDIYLPNIDKLRKNYKLGNFLGFRSAIVRSIK